MTRGERISLYLIALCAFAFSLAYALTNPPFEAPDEPAHLDYVNYVSQRWTMPDQLRDEPRVGQGHHHPLYYFLGAPFVAVLNSGHPVSYQTAPNRLASERDDVPRFGDGSTSLAQSSDRMAFYLLRALSSIFAAIAALYAALSARLVLGKPYALLAGLFVATLPQFQFVSGAVSNDALAACTGCIALYALLRAGLAQADWKAWAWAGFWVGIAVLAKKSNLVVVPAGLLWLAVFPQQASEGVRALRLRLGVAFVGALALTCGWLFVRNLVTYQDLLGTRMEAQTMPELVHPKSLTDPYFRGSFEKVTARTFFAHFGWMNVTVSLALILPLALVLFGGLAASWKALKEIARARVWWFAGVWAGLTVAGLFYYNMTFTQPQGRLLFPALGPLSLLIGAGAAMLLGRLDERKARYVAVALAAALVVIDVAALMTNLRFYGRPGIY